MTEVYLIRHGIAADRQEYTRDEDRPLTEEGQKKTKKVAKRLYEVGLRFDLILTSPLARSRQTADILAAAALCSTIEESACLAPDGDLHDWLNWLLEWSQDASSKCLALVGHQPDLSSWAEILVWGNAKEKLILKKAGVIGLTLPEMGTPIGNSQLFLLLSPKWLL